MGIDTWYSGHGKNGMRRDWHFHDRNTGQTILRATRFSSLYCTLFKLINTNGCLARLVRRP